MQVKQAQAEELSQKIEKLRADVKLHAARCGLLPSFLCPLLGSCGNVTVLCAAVSLRCLRQQQFESNLKANEDSIAQQKAQSESLQSQISQISVKSAGSLTCSQSLSIPLFCAAAERNTVHPRSATVAEGSRSRERQASILSPFVASKTKRVGIQVNRAPSCAAPSIIYLFLCSAVFFRKLDLQQQKFAQEKRDIQLATQQKQLEQSLSTINQEVDRSSAVLLLMLL